MKFCYFISLQMLRFLSRKMNIGNDLAKLPALTLNTEHRTLSFTFYGIKRTIKCQKLIVLDRQRLSKEKDSYEKIQITRLRNQAAPPGFTAFVCGLPPCGKMPLLPHLVSPEQGRVSEFCDRYLQKIPRKIHNGGKLHG